MQKSLATTFLFVPGDRPERFAKAAASGASLVVLDLEDAVAPDHKDAARDNIAQALGPGTLRACIRINGIDTPWFDDDCRLLHLAGVAAVMLPKADTQSGLAQVHAACAAGTPLVPIIETASGLIDVQAVARSAGVRQLAFGSVDFQQDLAIEGDGLELLHARSLLVLHSRGAGLAGPVDGVTLTTRDMDLVRDDALRARRLGFAGKLCIHPSQVPAVMQAFAPDAASVAWAHGVLADRKSVV